MSRASGTPTGELTPMCEWWKDERTQCVWPFEVEIPCVGYEAPHRVCNLHEKKARQHCQWKVSGNHEADQ